jgi:hypothetical protein
VVRIDEAEEVPASFSWRDAQRAMERAVACVTSACDGQLRMGIVPVPASNHPASWTSIFSGGRVYAEKSGDHGQMAHRHGQHLITMIRSPNAASRRQA